MKKILALVFIFALTNSNAQMLPYKNSSLPIETRLNDLLQRMTLEEQAAQLIGKFSIDSLAFDENGNFISTRDTAVLYHGVGSYSVWSLRHAQSLRRRTTDERHTAIYDRKNPFGHSGIHIRRIAPWVYG